jgi:hypothetical protein
MQELGCERRITPTRPEKLVRPWGCVGNVFSAVVEV